MSSYKYVYLLVLFLCSTLFFSGCKSTSSSSVSPNISCRQFDTYTNEYFDNQMKSNGLNLHFFLSNDADYPDADMSLGDYTYESMQDAQPFYIEQIKTLKKMDYNALDSKRQLTYDVLMEHFQGELDYSDLCLCSEDLSPTIGIQAQLPMIFSEYDFHNQSDIEHYFSLLKSIPEYYSGICDFQILKARNNCFISSDTCSAIIAQCQSFLDAEQVKGNIFYSSFIDRINQCAFLNEEEKTDYIKENEDIIIQYIFPSYHALIDTLTDLKNEGYCTNDNGLFYLKNGKEYYAYLVHSYTGSTLTVPEIKSMIQNQIVADMKQLYSLFTLYPELEIELSDIHSDMKPEAILSDLKKKFVQDFTGVEGLKYALKYVGKTLQDYLSPAFYISPPIDNPDNNVIFINPGKSGEDLYTVLAHEGIPGHMYQNAFFTATSPDKIRYLIDYGGYSEGWAVYAEIMSYKYQFDNEKKALALGYNMSYSLALYCLCDIGVNFEGWTLSDLQAFLSNYSIDDPESCKSIFQAVIEDPANYLKYYVGYLEIMKEKKYVMQQTGADFNLKKFHNALLSIGPAGFDVIHKWIMDEYNRQ